MEILFWAHQLFLNYKIMCAGHTKRALGQGFINWGTHMQIEFLNELAVCKHKGAFKPLRIRTWPIKSAEQTQLAGKQTVSNIQKLQGQPKNERKICRISYAESQFAVCDT